MISRAHLDEAVARGIIGAAQRDALLALADAGVPRLQPLEAARGFNGVTVAYAVGAVAVLFAFGWFLFERWSTLGAGGVLAVSLAYAAIFAVAAYALGRQGFHIAAAVATLLVVGMTPVVTWATLALTGVWYERPPSSPVVALPGRTAAESLRWLPIEVATIVAASIALWRVRFGLLALPIAIAAVFAALHLVPLFVEPALAFRVEPWMSLFAGCVLVLCAYALDQRQRRNEDYAQWLFLVGLAAMFFGIPEAWAHYRRIVPHLVALLSVGAIVVSLYLRRRIFLVFGAVGALAYLSYLAFDVFRRTLGFSIVLAGFGLVVILLTVWLQRRYPALARRVAAEQGSDRPSLPGGYLIFAAAAGLAFVLLLTSPPRARRFQRDVEERTRRALEEQRRLDSTAPAKPAIVR